MWCNQIFSLINNGTIQNIVVCDNYETANQLSRSMFGNNALAVDTTLYPVAIGDSYISGKFYRDGVEIPANPTEAREIEILQEITSELQSMTSDIEEALCDSDESYNQRLAEIEEALCELSELL